MARVVGLPAGHCLIILLCVFFFFFFCVLYLVFLHNLTVWNEPERLSFFAK
jgi:hypothetical protein